MAHFFRLFSVLIKSSEIYTRQISIASLQCKLSNRSLLIGVLFGTTVAKPTYELFKLQKRCARLILESPRDARSYDNFQKLVATG